ncbi:MAG: NUDIX domain-containing protein [Candidatus Jordarchaeum sp.]|uniref:NUDIX domain-containing protein n=1 Tax=Candidatus Jordarchaeum sp. TaxID=2823881 RepID=UPI004049C09D
MRSLDSLFSRYKNARKRIIEIPVIRSIFDYFVEEKWLRVVAVIKMKKGVVMIKKPVEVRDAYGNPMKMDGWILAGGKPEIHESYEQAVIREIREETGVEVEVEKLLGVYIFRFLNGGEQVDAILIAFSTRALRGTLKPGGEVQKVKLFEEINEKDIIQVPDWWYGFQIEMLEDAGIKIKKAL